MVTHLGWVIQKAAWWCEYTDCALKIYIDNLCTYGSQKLEVRKAFFYEEATTTTKMKNHWHFYLWKTAMVFHLILLHRGLAYDNCFQLFITVSFLITVRNRNYIIDLGFPFFIVNGMNSFSFRQLLLSLFKLSFINMCINKTSLNKKL